MASFSDYWELKVLDGTFGDPTTPTITAPVYLALCTVVPTDGSTGSTITEATGATGYARIAIAAADMSGAASGSKTNGNALTGAAITAGSATVIGFAICDALTVGNMLAWGTCTSTVISATQTPPTIAIGGLVVTLD